MDSIYFLRQTRVFAAVSELRKSRSIITGIIALSGSAMLLGCESELGCPKMNCGDFASQGAAQSAYDGNRSCYKNLDRDNDGIACENM